MKKGDRFSTITLKYMGFYEVKSKKMCCPKVQKTLILLCFLNKFCIATRTSQGVRN